MKKYLHSRFISSRWIINVFMVTQPPKQCRERYFFGGGARSILTARPAVRGNGQSETPDHRTLKRGPVKDLDKLVVLLTWGRAHSTPPRQKGPIGRIRHPECGRRQATLDLSNLTWASSRLRHRLRGLTQPIAHVPQNEHHLRALPPHPSRARCRELLRRPKMSQAAPEAVPLRWPPPGGR